jgi:hypothetical protein
MADLSFKIEAAVNEDPTAATGQLPAARWMELVENRTGSHASFDPSPAAYEGYLRWMASRPPGIYKRLTGIDNERNGEFILKALSVPMRP